MVPGFFLTFEGVDGSGKTTQLQLLAQALAARGLPVQTLRQPGGTALGDRIRALLLEAKAPNAESTSPTSLAELALLFADRAQALAAVVSPALTQGRLLLGDRWTDSTEAYQGAGRQLGVPLVQQLHQALCQGLQPDLTLLLLPALPVALARARLRGSAQPASPSDRFESEPDLFFERVHAQYQAIAAREPLRVVVVDSDGPIEEVHARIVQLVLERLPAHLLPAQLTPPSTGPR